MKKLDGNNLEVTESRVFGTEAGHRYGSRAA